MVIAIVAAIVAPVRKHRITPRTRGGRSNLRGIALACMTGLPVFGHGGIGPAHVPSAPILATIFKPRYLARLVPFAAGAAWRMRKLRARAPT